MTNLETMIKKLKNVERENYIFLRRRVNKGNGKKTLGWIVKREDSDKSIENIDFNTLNMMKYKLKENN